MKKDVRCDFDRDVWCLFGLPIDNLTLESTIQYICALSENKSDQARVLSTININWLILSLRDDSFRSSIIDSDICTIDGMPLLWLAQSLDLPMNSVVTGSGLIERLFTTPTPEHEKLSMYFFGGESGVAKMASHRTNQHAKQLTAVGYQSPGFGALNELSQQEVLKLINQCRPDILLVALGAQKGQQWIYQNKESLDAKLVSHLGATINFIAGRVKRAPKLFQKLGLEWLWRIIVEPKLISRYASDGCSLSKIVFERFFTFFKIKQLKKVTQHPNVGASAYAEYSPHETRIQINGDLTTKLDKSEVKKLFMRGVLREKSVVIQFENTNYLDSSILGLLLLLAKWQKRNDQTLVLENVNRSLDRFFRFHMMDKSFEALGFGWQKICIPQQQTCINDEQIKVDSSL